MQSMTLKRWQPVRSRQRRRATHRTLWGRGLELLEARTLLSISPTTIDTNSDVAPSAHLFPGDANADGRFDQFDMAHVLKVGKYETDQPAIWSEGDWNHDGVFGSDDWVLALESGQYMPTSSADAVIEEIGTADPTTNPILDPAPFVWTHVSSSEPHYVGVLEYGEATFDINGETLTTRAYRQEGGAYSIPGPTLNMVPGNKYVLRFRNLLPYEAPSSVHNDFKDPNITNVHTHGLHISGESPGDDVTRMFEGGFAGDYVYDIPADHMGGTFWYHAHHHGSTFLQVSTGGFGFIIIDDGQDQLPANVAAMEERQILIGYLDPNAAGTGGDTLVSGTFEPGWTVNGTVNGDLVIPPDTWQHWRVLVADSDARTKDVTIGANCETMLLARDGVWRTSAPKDLPTRTLNLTGASRADLAVRCSADSDIHVGNTTVANVLVNGDCRSGPSSFRSRRSLHVVGLPPCIPARPARGIRRQYRGYQHGRPHHQRRKVRRQHADIHPGR